MSYFPFFSSCFIIFNLLLRFAFVTLLLYLFDLFINIVGGNPRNLEVLKSNADVNQKVTLFRKVEDFFKLNEITQKIKSISIIGGGFLGSELACALGARGQDPRYDLEVTQIYRENGNMAKVSNEMLL